MRKFAFVSLLFTQFVFAGNGAGGGTDSHAETHAWFLGPDNTIRSCLKISPQFGVSEAEARQEIKAAYETWSKYLIDKNLRSKFGDFPVMATKISIASSCTGDEDLIFYLGTEDVQVKKAKQHYVNPYGFAERISFDWKKGWSKGFIWIAASGSVSHKGPNWKLPFRLRGILLHELGHTFGNGHVEGTIMREMSDFFSEIIEFPSSYSEFVLTHIDHRRELYVCVECSYQLKADTSLMDTFHRATGVPYTGQVEEILDMKMVDGRLVGTVTYQDNHGRWIFDLKTTALLVETQDSGRVFHSAISSPSFAVPDTASRTYSYFGKLSNVTKTFNVLVSRNVYGRVEIREAERGFLLFARVY
jgi:hypothetical protein